MPATGLSRRRRLVPVVTLGVLGTGWGVAGVLLLRAAGAVHATAHGGGHEPLGGADRAG